MRVSIAILIISVLLVGGPPPARAADSTPAAGNEAKTSADPDFKPEALWDGRKIVPFHALDNPKMVKASEAEGFLGDEEYILGVTVHGESRAYPTRFVWWHHFINDAIGGAPYLVSYCSVCNTGIRWDRRVNGKTLLFDFYGLYNGVVVMCERETETVFTQVTGKGVKGTLAGVQLTAVPLLDTTWGRWKKLHPDTLVMSPDNEYSVRYRAKGNAEPRGYDSFPAPFFRPTVTRGDLRLLPFDKILGIAITSADGKSESRRAYPLHAIQDAGGAVNDTVESTPVAVFLDPGTQTAVAVSRVLDGKTLTFEARKFADGVGFYDKETGSRWNIEGKAEEGPLAGKELSRLENHLSQWYGWAAYFPQTTIYGHTDPPKPGNPFADGK